jgi:hypothetical protein
MSAGLFADRNTGEIPLKKEDRHPRKVRGYKLKQTDHVSEQVKNLPMSPSVISIDVELQPIFGKLASKNKCVCCSM